MFCSRLPARFALWVVALGLIAGTACAQDAAALLKRASDTMGVDMLKSFRFTMPGALSAVAFINQDNLVERVESRFPAPVLGETTAVTTYSDYRDFGGVKFPMRIRQSQADFPVLDLTVNDKSSRRLELQVRCSATPPAYKPHQHLE